MKSYKSHTILICCLLLVLFILLFMLLLFSKKEWFGAANQSQPTTSGEITSELTSFNSEASTANSLSDSTAKDSAMESTSTLPEEIPLNPLDTDYVKVIDFIPTIYVELKYATSDNITKGAIYNFTDAYLRYGTVKKLMKVQTELNALGYSMKVWDAYRPVEAQYKLWAAKPDARYIANPNQGYTSHSIGNTIDVTLVNSDGSQIDMPSGFDNFTSKGDRNYSDVTPVQAKNALLLENMMKRYEFKPYSGEWWHFSDLQKYTYVNFIPK